MTVKETRRHNWIHALGAWRALTQKNYILDSLVGGLLGLFSAASLMIYRGDTGISLEILAIVWIISLITITLLLPLFIYSALKEWREFDRITAADPTLLEVKAHNPTLRKLKAFLPFSRTYRYRPWRANVSQIKRLIFRLR